MPQIRCTIKGVYMAMGTLGASPAVILDFDENHCLPIYIGLWEAISINNALNNETAPRPLTHDLFVEFLQKFKISMKYLIIDSLEDGVYYANLILEQDHHELTMDCRPSDGIAIGVRCHADIFIDSDVARSSSLQLDDLPRLVDLDTYLAS